METFATVRLLFERTFPKQKTDARMAVLMTEPTVQKMSMDDVQRILAAIDLGVYQGMKPELEAALRKYASDRAQAAVLIAARSAGTNSAELDAMLRQANAEAVEWAAKHSARLVTEITETTRDEMREMLEHAVSEGKTNEEIANEIADAYAFSSGRSERIARTETSFAENRGTLDGWKASGLVAGKEVLPDVDPCPICEANAAQGVIPVDGEFQSGDQGPPFHPNCECTMMAALVDD